MSGRQDLPRAPIAAASGRAPALDGVRVIDFSRVFAGPLCTMTLGDLGADVIKIESPAGDEARGFGPPWIAGQGMNFLAVNRNKRSVVLDLKSESGQAAARRLCAGADVVVENFRPGVADRLGIGAADLRSAHPELIVCRIAGFGRRGPSRDRPALDLILQAAAGVMHRQGRDGPPAGIVLTIADCYAAQLAVQAVLAALLARERDGLGQLVDVSLYEAMLAAQGYRMISAAHPDGGPDDIELPASVDVAPYGAFEAADGWVIVAVVTDRSWVALCKALALDDLAADPRLVTNAGRAERQDEVRARVAAALHGLPSEEILATLDHAGVPCGPIKSEAELFFDPDVLENGMMVEVEHPTAGRLWQLGMPFTLADTPMRFRRSAPLLGQHSLEVLGEAGLDDAELAAMRASGALLQADEPAEAA